MVVPRMPKNHLSNGNDAGGAVGYAKSSLLLLQRNDIDDDREQQELADASSVRQLHRSERWMVLIEP